MAPHSALPIDTRCAGNSEFRDLVTVPTIRRQGDMRGAISEAQMCHTRDERRFLRALAGQSENWEIVANNM